MKLSEELKEFINDIAWPSLDSEKVITVDGVEHYESEYNANEMVRKVKALEQQIEKMKCCANCVHSHGFNSRCEGCDGKTNWE